MNGGCLYEGDEINEGEEINEGVTQSFCSLLSSISD